MTTVWGCSPAVFTLVRAQAKSQAIIDDLPEDTSPIGLLAAIEQELSKGLKKEVH